MALSDTSIRNAKINPEKAVKLSDSEGMYLLLHPNGSKYFRLDYRLNGKRKTLALGVYPKTSLREARIKRDEARDKIAQGIDPGELRKEEKLAQSQLFQKISYEWLNSIAHTVRIGTQQKKVSRFERLIFPVLGHTPINEIKSPDVYALIKPLILKNQLETAHRVHSEISSVFAYAIAHGYTDYDPAQAVAAQLPPLKVKHRAALTDPKKLAQLLRDIENYQGTYIVQCALRFSALVFQRPGEIRQMEWKDIDLDSNEWRYFVTKTEVLHIVPLSRQSLAILNDIKSLTGSGRYVFPSSRNDGRPMSENTIITALKTLGYSSDVMTAHGFRSTASTLLNEQGWSPDAIERQLCHMPRDQIRAAYNRAQYLEERRRMMQHWADYLDQLKTGAVVIPLSGRS